MGWLTWLGSLFSAVNKFIEWFQQERLVELGTLREREAQAVQEKHDEDVAAKVDTLPVPSNPDAVLNGLLRPEDRH